MNVFLFLFLLLFSLPFNSRFTLVIFISVFFLVPRSLRVVYFACVFHIFVLLIRSHTTTKKGIRISLFNNTNSFLYKKGPNTSRARCQRINAIENEINLCHLSCFVVPSSICSILKFQFNIYLLINAFYVFHEFPFFLFRFFSPFL